MYVRKGGVPILGTYLRRSMTIEINRLVVIVLIFHILKLLLHGDFITDTSLLLCNINPSFIHKSLVSDMIFNTENIIPLYEFLDSFLFARQ